VRPGAVPLFGSAAGPLYDRFVQLGRRVQVVGPHGSGKSTLLAHFEREARVRDESVMRIRGVWPAAIAAGTTLLLVDELGTMSPRRLLARLPDATGVLLSVHHDTGLATLARMQIDLATARQIVAHLVSVRPARMPTDDELGGLLTQNEGNMRLVLSTLYDWYEDGALAEEHGS
jgi:hypothetical protein